MRASLLLLTSMMLAGAVACESTVERGTGGSAPGGGGQGGEGGAFADAYAAYGSIRVSTSDYDLDGGFHETSSRATASYRVSGTGVDGCEQAEQGACTVVDCDTTVSGLPEELLNAGTVTITGGADAITLTADAEGGYSEYAAATLVFTGGEPFVVKVAGKDAIPPHQIALTAPSRVTGPEPPANGYVVDRRVPFTQTWTGGAAGEVILRIASYELGPNDETVRSVTIDCPFDAASGTGSVPAEVLALLPAGGGYTSLWSVSKETVVAGDALVTFSAETNAITPSGFGLGAGVTVE